ncbi:MAG: TIGR03086 family metal-binding protein [Actinomycetota bacterium]|nr:TIGR03086 family metal-binding protein [Actinomycetota bacterium]
MDQLETLEFAVNGLRSVIASVDDSEMDVATACDPWTVRQLASHALNSQLLWVGILTGQDIVSMEDTMGAVPYDGDLVSISDDAATRAVATWGADGVLEGMHSTPFGELPGSAVVNFPTIDALAHSWDISAALGRSFEFAPEAIPAISAVVEATCTDATRSMGLFGAVTEPPSDATDTERLMAAAGRTVKR